MGHRHRHLHGRPDHAGGRRHPGKVRALAAKAVRPDPERQDTPRVAAVCVYPDMVETAVEALKGSGVHVASVATGFPAGRTQP